MKYKATKSFKLHGTDFKSGEIYTFTTKDIKKVSRVISVGWLEYIKEEVKEEKEVEKPETKAETLKPEVEKSETPKPETKAETKQASSTKK